MIPFLLGCLLPQAQCKEIKQVCASVHRGNAYWNGTIFDDKFPDYTIVIRCRNGKPVWIGRRPKA